MPAHADLRYWQLIVASTLLALMGTGCTLILPDAEALVSHKLPLAPVVAPRDAIDLEVYFVDRRIGDPLIGEGLWSALFEVSATSADVRNRLAADGFRFAMSPTRPPRTLQSLLKLSSEEDPSRRVIPRKYTVPSGQETLLLISTVPDGTPLTIKNSDNVKTTELHDGQCLLRVVAEKVEEGWTRLSIVPEIRHGTATMRPVATDQDWEFRESQQTMSFYQHQLSAELNTGEILVMGLNPSEPQSLASHFFRSDISRGVERLILIRVTDMRRVQPVRVSPE
jgi:hypothetical protein